MSEVIRTGNSLWLFCVVPTSEPQIQNGKKKGMVCECIPFGRLCVMSFHVYYLIFTFIGRYLLSFTCEITEAHKFLREAQNYILKKYPAAPNSTSTPDFACDVLRAILKRD